MNRRLARNVAAIGVGTATTLAMIGGTALAAKHPATTTTATTTTVTTTLPPAACTGTYTRLVSVSTASALAAALKAAHPGDQIRLATGSYVGHFVAAVAGLPVGDSASEEVDLGARAAIESVTVTI